MGMRRTLRLGLRWVRRLVDTCIVSVVLRVWGISKEGGLVD